MIAHVLEHYRLCILVAAAVVVQGLLSFAGLPRTEDPEFDVASCAVATLWPGVDARQVEDLVTRPLEDALEEIDDVDRVESVSSAGVSSLIVVFSESAAPADVLEDVREKVAEARSGLPDGARTPEVIEHSIWSIPVMVVALQGPDDFTRLEDWAERLERELEGVDRVSQVEIEGLPERQIQVLVDQARLSQHRIPLTRVRDVVALENAATPGGELDVGPRRFQVKSPNRIESLDRLAALPVAAIGDSVIALGDVAEVVDGFADPVYLARTDQRATLLVTVSKKKHTNTVAVGDAVRGRLEAFRGRLPEGFELTIVSDRGRNVRELLGNLRRNAVGGAVIVALMTILFLGVRQALVVSISIPVSVLIAFILMDVSSVDLNQVSIFGLVMALGMLVDSALVVVESIGLQREQGQPLFQAVVSGVRQVQAAVVSSALTTIAAFVPLLAMRGDAGAFIRGLPLAVVFSIVGSVAVALTVVPLLSYATWKRFPAAGWSGVAMTRLGEAYRELAKRALRNRVATLALAVAAFAGAVAAIPALGIQYFPRAEKRFFFVNVRLPRDASFETTRAVTAEVESLLTAEPQVRDVTANVGKGSPRIYYNEMREAESPRFAQILVNLRDDFSGSVESFAASLQPKLRRVSGATVEIRILQQGPGRGAPIEVRVSGPDLETLARLSRQIQARIADVPGVTDLRDSLGGTAPRLALGFDRTKAALLGVDGLTFAETVQIATDGQVASQYRGAGEDEEVPIVVRLRPESIREISDLDGLYVPSASGAMVPFGELATASREEAFVQLERARGRRRVTVECDVSGRLTQDVLDDIAARLDDWHPPEGYELSFGGEREDRDRSFAGLGQALVLACLLIYAILAVQFNSFLQPFVILFTVPFGVVGAVLGLYVTGNPFGFMAFVGIVGLTGIIVNDSIVLTDYTNYLQRVEGKGTYQSLLDAGQRRLRPVVLTSITTMGGMAPLAIWGGSIWSPMATSLIFGLGSATVLILVVLPVIYSLLVGRRERHRSHRLGPSLWRRLWQGDADAREARVVRR